MPTVNLKESDTCHPPLHHFGLFPPPPPPPLGFVGVGFFLSKLTSYFYGFFLSTTGAIDPKAPLHPLIISFSSPVIVPHSPQSATPPPLPLPPLLLIFPPPPPPPPPPPTTRPPTPKPSSRASFLLAVFFFSLLFFFFFPVILPLCRTALPCRLVLLLTRGSIPPPSTFP